MFPLPAIYTDVISLFFLTGDVYIQPTQDTKNPVIYGVFSVSGLVYYYRSCIHTTAIIGSVFVTWDQFSWLFFSSTSQFCLQRLSSLCLFHGRHPHGLQWTLRPQGGSQLPMGGLHWEDPLPSPWHGEPHLILTPHVKIPQPTGTSVISLWLGPQIETMWTR